MRFPENRFRHLVDLVGRFVTHRLARQQRGHNGTGRHNVTAGLVPSISSSGTATSAQLHAALGTGIRPLSPKDTDNKVTYSGDWQIKAAAKAMSLLFSANVNGSWRHQETAQGSTSTNRSSLLGGSGGSMQSDDIPKTSPIRDGQSTRQWAYQHAQLLPTSTFYNMLLDHSDLVADFEVWESQRGQFSFCQYPMFLSIWAKIHILEYDARRQMEIRAREAFFNSILTRKAISQYLVLKVRRECLVEDSLRGVSEVVGAGQEEIKKGLRITFRGEEGVDAGG